MKNNEILKKNVKFWKKTYKNEKIMVVWHEHTFFHYDKAWWHFLIYGGLRKSIMIGAGKLWWPRLLHDDFFETLC